MSKKPAIFSATEQHTLRSAISHVWACIAPDDCTNNAEAIEVCIDADRLATYSHIDAQQLVRAAVQRFGYTPVLRALCKAVRLI